MKHITGKHLIRLASVPTQDGYKTHSGIPVRGSHYTRFVSSLDDLCEGEKADVFQQYLLLSDQLEKALARFSTMQPQSTDDGYLMGQIIEKMCATKGIDPKVMVSETRRPDVTWLRHKCIYLIRKKTRLSSPAVGARFNRNYTTVLNSEKVVSDRMDVDKAFREEMRHLLTLDFNDEINFQIRQAV